MVLQKCNISTTGTVVSRAVLPKMNKTLNNLFFVENLNSFFFRKRRLWSMGADRRRRRSRSHDPGSRSEPAPDSQDSETFQKTRSPSSHSGNSNSRERRRRKKRLRSRSRGYEQRSRWAMLKKVFDNSKFSFYEITWLWFSNCAQFLSWKHLIRTILVFQLTRIKICLDDDGEVSPACSGAADWEMCAATHVPCPSIWLAVCPTKS